jgi:hypothetical protein
MKSEPERNVKHKVVLIHAQFGKERGGGMSETVCVAVIWVAAVPER